MLSQLFSLPPAHKFEQDLTRVVWLEDSIQNSVHRFMATAIAEDGNHFPCEALTRTRIRFHVAILDQLPAPSAGLQWRDSMPQHHVSMLVQVSDFFLVHFPSLDTYWNKVKLFLAQQSPPSGFTADLRGSWGEFRMACWRLFNWAWLIAKITWNMKNWSAKAECELRKSSGICPDFANRGAPKLS